MVFVTRGGGKLWTNHGFSPLEAGSLSLTWLCLRSRRRGACYETVDTSDLVRVVLDLAGGAFTANQAVQVVQGSAKKMTCTSSAS
jgi:hypothetical protein